MVCTVFVSYDHEDQEQSNAFKGIAANPNHPLEFVDGSLQRPVRDANDNIIANPPEHLRSEPVRRQLKGLLSECERLVVLVGNNTHQKKWVDWEVDTFLSFEEKSAKDVYAMRLKEHPKGKLPRRIEDLVEPQPWGLDELRRWLR